MSLTSCYRKHKNEKHRNYEARIREIEHSTFTALVLSTSGTMAPAAKVTYNRLASLIDEKHQQPYSLTVNWLRCKLSFSLIRSAVMCLHGARSSYHRPSNLSESPTRVTKLSPTSQTQSVIRSELVGVRDFSAQEKTLMLLRLPLYSSKYSFVTLNLDSSGPIKATQPQQSTNSQLITNSTIVDFYSKSTAPITMNLISFVSKFTVTQNQLKTRRSTVIIRTFPSYSPYPNGTHYAQYCKYQLIKYKP